MKKIFVLIAISLQLNVFSQENQFKINDVVPNIVGIDQNNQTVNLNDWTKQGDVVLFFYRGQWCPYCNKQMKNLQDSLNLLTNKKVRVLAVTPETMESSKKAIEKTGAKFSIVNDKDYAIMQSFKVNFVVDTAMISRYKNYKIDLIEANKNTNVQLPVPATYIITKDRKVKFVYFNKDYRSRVSIKTLLENL